MLSHFIQSTWGAGGDTIQIPVADPAFANEGDVAGAPIYSGVLFGSDGMVYRYTTYGAMQSIGSWLLSGTASDFYVSGTVTAGGLTSNAGISQVLSSNRAYYITQSIPDKFKTCTVTFKIFDNGSETEQNGFPIIRSYSFSAYANS
jgi:hypothetical protein